MRENNGYLIPLLAQNKIINDALVTAFYEFIIISVYFYDDNVEHILPKALWFISNVVQLVKYIFHIVYQDRGTKILHMYLLSNITKPAGPNSTMLPYSIVEWNTSILKLHVWWILGRVILWCDLAHIDAMLIWLH